jgi:hypothetical protein
MKISQEHIDAALKWSDYKPHSPSEFTSGDMAVLLDYQFDGSFASTTAASMNILAAAYRDLLVKNEELREDLKAEWERFAAGASN